VRLHLAQFNVGTLRAPIDHPDTQPFAESLQMVNAAGDVAPGFVWRLQDDGGNATAIAAYEDPNTIVNLTVWESVDQLRDFAYEGVHRDYLRRRAEWFRPGASGAVMWWIPEGTVPTVAEAKRRLRFLRLFGPSAHASPTGRGPRSVVVRRHLHHPDVSPMLRQLDNELTTTEPDGGTCFLRLDTEEVTGDAGAFFVAYVDGVASACGAYRRIGPHTAEVKRMWAEPAMRGSKIGAAVLDTIESHAVTAGMRELKLETGEHLVPAVALYRKFGFAECKPWGEYVDSPLSYCMRKSLA
jgi:GNAT superfamily N-acetyltransferase